MHPFLEYVTFTVILLTPCLQNHLRSLWAARLAQRLVFDVKTILDSEISDLSSKVLRIALVLRITYTRFLTPK